MARGMRICLALLLALPRPAFAQTPIIVTGRPLPEARGEDAYGAVIIARDRLTADASGRIENILADVAGFQQFRRTDSRAANPTTQGASLRALGGNAASRALVLLDGVPQADPFTGYIPFSTLRPERFSRITATRGGGAGAFGAGAVAGTIAIESGGLGDLPGVSLNAVGGSRNSSEVSGGLSGQIGTGFASVTTGWDRGDGYIITPVRQRGPADIPARYDAWSLALRSVVPVAARAELQASALVFDDHRLRGLAGTASRSRGADASIRYVARGPWGVEALAYVQERGFRSGFVAVDAARTVTTPTLDQFATPSLGIGGKIEIRPPVGANRSLRIGIDYRRASGTTNERFRFQSGGFTRLRRAGGVNTTGGAFAEAGASFGALTLTTGARLDRWSIANGSLIESEIGTGTPTLMQAFPNRSGWRASTRGGAVWRTGPFALRAAAYTGFRLPTLNELYRPFRVGADATAANDALGLEELRGYEAGFSLERGGLKFALTAFDNHLAGAIANVSLGTGPGNFQQVGFVAAGGTYRQRQNLDAIEARGVEAEAALTHGPLRATASYAYTDATVRASGPGLALSGRRPAQSPAHQASLSLAYTDQQITASATARYSGARFDDDLEARRLPDALTVDGFASYRIAPNMRIVARAQNLFDAQVISGITANGIEDLGTPRTLWLGLSFAR